MAFHGAADDLAALRALLDDYCDAVFRRDADDWGACWTQDSRWTLMGQTVEGRGAIVALWQAAMADFAFVAFFAQPGAIEVDGDRATGRVHTHELLEHADGTISRPIGRYDDIYQRTPDGWRFAARTYTLLHGG